jgi:hypothetical protein
MKIITPETKKMKAKIVLALALSVMPLVILNAQTSDEKVLEMLKKLNTTQNSDAGAIGLPVPASREEQEFAKRSQSMEMFNKENDMLSSRVQSDLAFEQKLPRAIGYSEIGNTMTAVIEFSGKRFRLNINDEIAGWTIKSITKNNVHMVNRDGYIFKSHFDIKQ